MSSDRSTASAWTQLEARIHAAPTPARSSIAALSQAAQRYLQHAVGAAPLAGAVQLEMRGRIKIGRWLPFRARQLLAPRLGTVWAARVGRVIVGSDRYVGGSGGMDWWLFNRLRIVHAEGRDVTRSAAERAAGESIWAPAAVWPQPGVTWTAEGDQDIQATFDVDGHPVELHHRLDGDGALRSSWFLRWGDPDRTGTWQLHPFGVEVTSEATFGGITIPARGRAGWHHGTARWDEGVFFEFEITTHRSMGG